MSLENILFEEAYQRVRQELAYELLQTVLSYSPIFFEQLVVDLIVKMGYGGTRKDGAFSLFSLGWVFAYYGLKLSTPARRIDRRLTSMAGF
jgi:hypothetical protein